MGRNSFAFFVPAMLRKLKRSSLRTEPGVLEVASVCSCDPSKGLHKVRKITRKLGNLIPIKMVTRLRLASNVSATSESEELLLMPASLHFGSGKCKLYQNRKS